MKIRWWLFASAMGAAFLHCASAQTPQVFAPGVISGPTSDVGAAFLPDGATVLFSRDGAIMVSTRLAEGWSAPRIAPFSGQWMAPNRRWRPTIRISSSSPIAR